MFAEAAVFHYSVFKGVKAEIYCFNLKGKTIENLKSQRTWELNYKNIGKGKHIHSVIMT